MHQTSIIFNDTPKNVVKECNADYVTLSRKPSDYKRVKIGQSIDAFNYIKEFYHEDIAIYESVFILLLSSAMETIGYAKISHGGTSSALMDIRIIAKYALETLASGVIIAHNHPSGLMKPSNADCTVTDRIKNGLKLLDINLLDHIILHPDKKQYVSFGDDGLLEP